MAQAPLLTLIFHGSFGAYRKNGEGRRMASVATWSPLKTDRQPEMHP